MNRLNFLRAEGLRLRALIASPFFARAMIPPKDRRTMILARSRVNSLDRAPRDPG